MLTIQQRICHAQHARAAHRKTARITEETAMFSGVRSLARWSASRTTATIVSLAIEATPTRLTIRDHRVAMTRGFPEEIGANATRAEKRQTW
jgi:hypothetical protein